MIELGSGIAYALVYKPDGRLMAIGLYPEYPPLRLLPLRLLSGRGARCLHHGGHHRCGDLGKLVTGGIKSRVDIIDIDRFNRFNCTNITDRNWKSIRSIIGAASSTAMPTSQGLTQHDNRHIARCRAGKGRRRPQEPRRRQGRPESGQKGDSAKAANKGNVNKGNVKQAANTKAKDAGNRAKQAGNQKAAQNKGRRQ